MAFESDLEQAVSRFFRDGWSEREGVVVPETDDLRLYNDGVTLDAVVLYADMAESTVLVDNYVPKFAAEVYKAFLYCSARIIELRGGTVTAYDGDRVMGVFIGDWKNSSAAQAALNINHAVQKIIGPALKHQYPTTNYTLGHCVGIDASNLLVARTGVRGANDLVWVGRAANYAAKLSGLRTPGYRSIITGSVYDSMANHAKISTSGEYMWTPLVVAAMPGARLYGSTWMWSP